jgi:hypothetical protein
MRAIHTSFQMDKSNTSAQIVDLSLEGIGDLRTEVIVDECDVIANLAGELIAYCVPRFGPLEELEA